MIKLIKAWLKARREQHARDLFNRGYGFAAAMLLHGSSPEEIEAMTYYAFEHNGFEDGVASALRDYNKLLARPVVSA